MLRQAKVDGRQLGASHRFQEPNGRLHKQPVLSDHTISKTCNNPPYDTLSTDSSLVQLFLADVTNAVCGRQVRGSWQGDAAKSIAASLMPYKQATAHQQLTLPLCFATRQKSGGLQCIDS